MPLLHGNSLLIKFVIIQPSDADLLYTADSTLTKKGSNNYACLSFWYYMECLLKVEYHANENPLQNSEKNSICWSKINVSDNQKRIISYHASFYF